MSRSARRLASAYFGAVSSRSAVTTKVKIPNMLAFAREDGLAPHDAICPRARRAGGVIVNALISPHSCFLSFRFKRAHASASLH
jgi:hypothetical protein